MMTQLRPSCFLLKLFFVVFSICIPLNVSSQTANITIVENGVTIKEAITILEKKSKLIFFYADKDIDLSRKVNLNIKNQPLTKVLDELFRNSNNTYKVDGNQVYIIRKPEQKVAPTQQKKIKITGVVYDEKKEQVIGATVVLLGSNLGTITDLDGRFVLDVPENSQLKVSYVGYETKIVDVKGKTVFSVTLAQAETKLEELVITAQAIGQKNAIKQQINSTTIKNVVAADRLQENPDANATEAIGRLPGISVLRNGGEGTGLVIRGLEPKYTSVTLNGVQLPSSGSGSRETNISGISQYVLQGVEVYKSLTADMEANSVAGTVNLKLREAADGFHSNFMAQYGYNNMNRYLGNYKFMAELSNRFFNKKLGLFFTASSEKVNRSTQTMGASYSLYSSDPNDGFLIDGVNLNYILKTKFRNSAMLALDYKLKNTTLNLYGLYTYTKTDQQSQSKVFSATTGTGNESLSFYYSPNSYSNIFQTALSGITKPKFLNMEIDYGLSFSEDIGGDPQSRSWGFYYSPIPTTTSFTQDLRLNSSPEDIVSYYNDKDAADSTLLFNTMGQSSRSFSEKNLSSYANIKIPFKIGEKITGNVKFGGVFRTKNRKMDILSGSHFIGNNQFGEDILLNEFPWLVESGLNKAISAEGLKDYRVNNFMDGRFDYGYYYDFSKLNMITDKWIDVCNEYYKQGGDTWEGNKYKLGFQQNIAASILNDEDILENYYAGYIMSEINIGKLIMLLPGIRYEKTDAKMNGFYAIEPNIPGSIYDPIPGNTTSATRKDEFWLPMIHARIKPTKFFYTHFAYTKTLGRPDFSAISPNTWVNTGIPPFVYTSTQANIRVEQWTNYDVQFTFHGSKIGLLSLSGFYKTVKDKIWTRSYDRIKGDPIIDPFRDADVVKVTITENHPYPIYLKGFEIELQTSFWYLPAPFKYFTFSSNYTFTDSQTQNPYSYVKSVVPEGGGRPVAVRVDSTTTGVMLYQPKHIVNFSAGFNKGGLNVWLSYQFNGMIYTYVDQHFEGKNGLKKFYNRWDLQISQKLKGKLKGLEVLLNAANLNNFTESTGLQGDSRPTYLEKYGWTADVGLRYKF